MLINMDLLYNIQIHRQDGSLRYDSGEVQSESYVVAFMHHLWTALRGATSTVTDTGGTPQTLQVPTSSSNWFIVDNSGGDVTEGIIIGTGTTAVTMTDNVIETIIPDATLAYGVGVISSVSVITGQASFTITRGFANSSGGNVTVSETAIYVDSEDTGATVRTFMIVRDVLSTAAIVANGETLTVTYTIKITT